jgi:Short C-terminal domain
MPFVRRRPLLRAAAVGGVAYMGAKAGSNRAMANAQAQPEPAPQAAPAPPPAPAPVAPAPVAPATGASDRIAELKQLAELKDSGVLTQAEFDKEKARILA